MTIKWEFENKGKRYGSEITNISIPESLEGCSEVINIVSTQMKLSLQKILFSKTELEKLENSLLDNNNSDMK